MESGPGDDGGRRRQRTEPQPRGRRREPKDPGGEADQPRKRDADTDACEHDACPRRAAAAREDRQDPAGNADEHACARDAREKPKDERGHERVGQSHGERQERDRQRAPRAPRVTEQDRARSTRAPPPDSPHSSRKQANAPSCSSAPVACCINGSIGVKAKRPMPIADASAIRPASAAIGAVGAASSSEIVRAATSVPGRWRAAPGWRRTRSGARAHGDPQGSGPRRCARDTCRGGRVVRHPRKQSTTAGKNAGRRQRRLRPASSPRPTPRSGHTEGRSRMGGGLRLCRADTIDSLTYSRFVNSMALIKKESAQGLDPASPRFGTTRFGCLFYGAQTIRQSVRRRDRVRLALFVTGTPDHREGLRALPRRAGPPSISQLEFADAGGLVAMRGQTVPARRHVVDNPQGRRNLAMPIEQRGLGRGCNSAAGERRRALASEPTASK